MFRASIYSLVFTVLTTVPNNGVTETKNDLGFRCSFSRTSSRLTSAQLSNTFSQNRLRAILDDNAQLEKVARGFQFLEGPLWHPKGFLLFSDIPANTIYQWTANEEPKTFRRPSGNANGNTLDSEGRLLSAEHGNRRISRTEKDGTVVTLASHFEGKRLNSPNDLSDIGSFFTNNF
ncbi:MAG: SMP-30/gluconolactonase/LRE family protein [Phormidium sp.]